MRAFRMVSAATLTIALAACGSQHSEDEEGEPLAASSPSGSGLACGVERWAIKTLSDPDAAVIDPRRVTTTTIAALNALPRQCGGAGDRRLAPQEFQVYEVVGKVTVVRHEDDRDYHVVLAEPSDPKTTVIVEIPDPECSGAIDSSFLTTLQQTRSAFLALGGTSLVGRTVRVQGVGFYDYDHGQTGRSSSCIELHPLTSIQLVG